MLSFARRNSTKVEGLFFDIHPDTLRSRHPHSPSTLLPSGQRSNLNCQGTDILLIPHALHEFFYYHEHSVEADHARRRYLECIPLFDSEKEKNDFHTYAALHFSTAELPPACFVPSISSRHTQGMNFQVFEDEYKDALRIQVLLTRFRQEACRN